MLSYLSSALLLLVTGVASAQHSVSYYEPYLAPHEQRVYKALDNVNKNYNAFMKVFAKNAYCELTYGKDSDDITIKSGPCREVFSNYGNMAQYKVRWYPITNTDPKQPEKGVLSYVFVNYGLSKSGCEGLFYGTSEVKFNVGGQITDLRGHSTDKLNFMRCIDGSNQRRRIIEEEIYLAPHEQNVFDAFNNMHEDFDNFMDVFANAQCEIVAGQAPKEITVMKGPCREEWRQYDNLIHTKTRWWPVTNTHAKYPDKGVLAVHFSHYALADNDCEGLIGGTGSFTFNKKGQVTRVKSYIDSTDFMDCYTDNNTRETK